MQPLLSSRQPLPVQHRVNVAREDRPGAVTLLPRRAKAIGVVAAAKETWPMPGGEGCRLVEKEQLGPASAAHHLAPPSPEFADAGEPGRAGPAFLQQGFGCGIMDDAAIAGEQAAMRGGDDVACRRDPVLQRHEKARLFATPVIARSLATKQSSLQHYGLLRFARNDDG